MTPDIYFENTLTRKKELFKSLETGVVKLYSCGPTVYHYAHLGNLRAYVTTDLVRRTLVSAGYDVHAVINITDIGHLVSDGDIGEDKIEKAMTREGKTAQEIARFYENAFKEDLEQLNIPKKDYLFPRATEYIEEQKDMVIELIKKDFAYEANDGIYFDTSKYVGHGYTDYGKLTGNKVDLDLFGDYGRIVPTSGKRHMADFALWKYAKQSSSEDTSGKRLQEWESPWSEKLRTTGGVKPSGFPGWHIECSAMSKKLLGPHFDIHMGGIDHIPVHHTNEIAQSECANGEKYVNYWLHYNFLNDATGKMSKSNGEFLRLQTVIDKGVTPLAYRYFLLLTHYRSEIQFSFESLRAAETAYKKLFTLMSDWNTIYQGSQKIPHKETLNAFYTALYDDLGTPKAVATLWTMLADSTLSDEEKYVTILAMDNVLGLDLARARKEELVIRDEVKALLEKRKLARDAKDFPLSDSLRAEIRTHGFDVKDTKDGQELLKI